MKTIDKIKTSYPCSTQHRINECFIPNKGWIRMFGVHLVPITDNTIEKLKKQKVTHINVFLLDEFECERMSDFSVNELLNQI